MWRPVLILAFCLMAGIAAASPLDDAEQAILQCRAVDAIATVEAFRPATRTQTLRRLWILGVANNRAGRPRDAVAPLARLVAQVPGNPVFRLELATALIRSNQTERARYHLELVQGANLPPALRTRVQSELDRLAKPRPWQGYLRFALIPESNAARRTAADSLNFGGLVFGIDPNARAKPANGVELGFGLAALPRLGESLRGRIGADLQARVFDGNAPDDVTLRLGAALLHFGDGGRQLSFELYASQRWLDNRKYALTKGVVLGYTRTLGPKARVSASLLRENIDYSTGGFTLARSALSVRLAYVARPQLVLRIGARVEDRSSRGGNLAGQAAGLTIGGDYAFAGGLRFGLDLSYDRNAFDGLHPLFGVERIDNKVSAAMQLTNQNWNYMGFAPVLKLGLERQRSSIVVNSYSNLSASIGMTRSF